LVGIAGEDDIDISDLNAPTAAAFGAEKPAPNSAAARTAANDILPNKSQAVAVQKLLAPPNQSLSLNHRPLCATNLRPN
jgi:hypothetical protein